jgi:predicted secreted hydrolase
MNARTLAFLALIPAAAAAQGYADLGQSTAGFLPVTPPANFEFPADHAPHPGFRIEWWYVTANLQGPDGTPYGAQWTLFRQALTPGPDRSGWQSPVVWMGHAAATSATEHRFAETFARGGIGQAGVTLGPFAAWIDDWTLTGDDDLSRLQMIAAGDDFSYDLALAADTPPVPQGENGYSMKSPQGQAS